MILTTGTGGGFLDSSYTPKSQEAEDHRGRSYGDPESGTGVARRGRAPQVRQLRNRKDQAHRHSRQRTHVHRMAGEPMKLGLQLNSFDWRGGAANFATNLAAVARAAEEAGFDRIGVADHLWQHPIMGGPEVDEPECYTTLGYLAASTARLPEPRPTGRPMRTSRQSYTSPRAPSATTSPPPSKNLGPATAWRPRASPKGRAGSRPDHAR